MEVCPRDLAQFAEHAFHISVMICYEISQIWILYINSHGVNIFFCFRILLFSTQYLRYFLHLGPCPNFLRHAVKAIAHPDHSYVKRSGRAHHAELTLHIPVMLCYKLLWMWIVYISFLDSIFYVYISFEKDIIKSCWHIPSELSSVQTRLLLRL